MWMRLSQKAYEAIAHAQEEARQRGENRVGSGHLLLGILTVRERRVTTVLSVLEISIEALQEVIHSQLSTSSQPTSNLALNSAVKRAIDCAYEEARRFGESDIRTDHLLLGVLRVQETPCKPGFWSLWRHPEPEEPVMAFLPSYGLTWERVREILIAVQQNTLLIPSGAPATESTLLRTVEEEQAASSHDLLRSSENEP